MKKLKSAEYECVRALQWCWLMAYRHMPNDRHTLDKIGDLLDDLLERYCDD